MDNLESVAPSPSLSLAELEAQIPSEHDEPAPAKETPEPKAQQVTEQQPQEQPKSIDPSQFEAMQKQLVAMQRELGQARKLQAEFAKMRESQNKPAPNALSELDPESREKVKGIVKSVFGEEYGEKMAALEEIRAQMEEQQELSGFIDNVKMAAGDNLKSLAPTMSQLLDAAARDRDAGNENAERWLQKVKAAPELLVYHAKEIYSRSAEGKATEARAVQESKAGKAATTLKPGAKPAPTPNHDFRKMSLKELEELIPDENGV